MSHRRNIEKKYRIQIWDAIHADDPSLLPKFITANIFGWRSARGFMWKKDHNRWKTLLWQIARGKQGPNGRHCPNILKFAKERFEFSSDELEEAGMQN